MFKVFIFIYFILSISNLKAQSKIGIGLGLLYANIFDERLNIKKYSGIGNNYILTYQAKNKTEIGLSVYLNQLHPITTSLLVKEDYFDFKDLNLRVLTNYNLSDSTSSSYRLSIGMAFDLYARNNILQQFSTILPYSEILFSNQIALSLGFHFDIFFILSQKQKIQFRIIFFGLNSGLNNSYSPHDKTLIFKTLLVPSFVNISTPIIYSFAISKKNEISLSANGELYFYKNLLENRIFKISSQINYLLKF